MAVFRTILWIALVCGLLIFSFYNWRPVEVTIWENLVLETKVPVLIVLAFLLGFIPLLAYHLSVKWALKRRVRNLESSLKRLATSPRQDPASSGGDAAVMPAAVTAGDSKKTPASDKPHQDAFDGDGDGDGGGGGDGGDGGGD